MTMNVQLVDELREVADWFRLRELDENAALLDHAAHTVQCAANFFAWYNKYYPEPSSHPLHPWCILGAILTSEKNDSARAAQQSAAVDGEIDKARFERAPCYICGYNGPGYYNPDNHPCAAKYHATHSKEMSND